MTNTDTAAQLAEDRATFELWKAMQLEAFEATGCTHYMSPQKAARMKKRHSTPPEDMFTGPWFALKPWLTTEAIEWFEVLGNPRHTFTSWQAMQRENRATEAEYAAEESSPLATLEYMRDMQLRRGALIAEARAEGASWADVMAATGLSRMQAHTLAKEATAAAEMAAADAAYVDSDEPF